MRIQSYKNELPIFKMQQNLFKVRNKLISEKGSFFFCQDVPVINERENL